MYSYFMSDYFIRFPSFGKDFIFVCLVVTFTFKGIFCKIKKPSLISMVYIFFLISYWLIGLINNAPDKFAIRYYLFPLIIYYIITNLKTEYIMLLLKGMKFYFFTLLAIGYFQVFNKLDIFKEIFMEPLALLLLNLKIHRLYLFFNYPILASLTLVILSLYFLLFNRNYIYTIISLPIIFVTFSRTAVVAYIISILVYLILESPKYIKMMSLILITVFIIWAYTFITNDEAFLMRIDLITDKWKEITFFGHGIGFCTVSNFASEIKIFDNDYLRMLYELGVCGLSAFCVFGLKCFWSVKSSESFTYILFAILTMFTCDFHSMYPVAILYYIMLGIIEKTNEKGVLLKTIHLNKLETFGIKYS